MNDQVEKHLRAYGKSKNLASRKGLYAYTTGPAIIELMIRFLKPFIGMSVLDAGCGYGDNLIELVKRFTPTRAVGFDQSEGQIADARKSAEEAGLPINFLVDDVETFDLSETFDRILVSHVLHVPENREKALETILKHLAPGGVALFLLHSDLNLQKRAAWNTWLLETYGIKKSTRWEDFTVESSRELFASLPYAVHETLVDDSVELTAPEPYTEYLESTRHRCEPAPTDEQWQAYLNHARDEMEDEIEKNGSFVDPTMYGFVTVTK